MRSWHTPFPVFVPHLQVAVEKFEFCFSTERAVVWFLWVLKSTKGLSLTDISVTLWRTWKNNLTLLLRYLSSGYPHDNSSGHPLKWHLNCFLQIEVICAWCEALWELQHMLSVFGYTTCRSEMLLCKLRENFHVFLCKRELLGRQQRNSSKEKEATWVLLITNELC